MKTFLLFFACGSLLSAQETATKLIELDKTPSARILEDEGVKVRVKGFVESTRTNTTGIHFLEFKDTDFVCVTFARHVGDFPDGPPAEAYKEKWIEVTGEIQNYRGVPQIRIESPDQVKILDTPPPPVPVEITNPIVTEPTKKEPKEDKPEQVSVPEITGGRVVEVIDGVEALDWRKYFPE